MRDALILMRTVNTCLYNNVTDCNITGDRLISLWSVIFRNAFVEIEMVICEVSIFLIICRDYTILHLVLILF